MRDVQDFGRWLSRMPPDICTRAHLPKKKKEREREKKEEEEAKLGQKSTDTDTHVAALSFSRKLTICGYRKRERKE